MKLFKAYITLNRSESGVNAYGVSIYTDDNEWHALISEHLPEPLGVLASIRHALSAAVNVVGQDSGIIAYGSEAAFRHRRLADRVTSHIDGTTIRLSYRQAGYSSKDARALAEDAVRRGNSITEILN